VPRTKKPLDRGRRTRALEKGALLSLALGELACSPAAPPPPADQPAPAVTIPAAPSAASSAAGPAADDAQEAIDRLLPYVVLQDKPARRTLYTWTTRAQIEEIARDRVLLTRTESAEHGASYFDQVLEKRAAAKDPLAQKLRTSAFARARFAWPAPWATFLGFPGETYGDELLQVTLKPSALIAVLRTSQPELTVVDMENRPVAVADALAHPERIAVVYFVHDTPKTGYAASMAGPEERLAYREYVLCNESMIEAFAARTPEIAQEIERSADAAQAMGHFLRAHPARSLLAASWNVAVAKEAWTRAEPVRTPRGVYEATLSFPNELYLPAAGPLIALADKLRALKTSGPPIVHQPTAAFPAPTAVKPSPPPRKVPKPGQGGTF
jgi:hypothetical protein